MNGTAHASLGAGAGFIAANTVQADAQVTFILVGLGAVSALVPDMDIDGKLRGKMTLSHEFIRAISQVIAILMIIYSFYAGEEGRQYLGIGIGIAILIISSRLKQKHMLTLTAIGVIAGGFSLQEIWLFLFGIYALIASFASHRGYTHSILGVIFFALIVKQLEISLEIHGVYYTCLAGYISHLITDSKVLPFNKRGIKLFLPFSSKEV